MKAKLYYIIAISLLLNLVIFTIVFFGCLLVMNSYLFLWLFFGFYFFNIILSILMLNSNKRHDAMMSWFIVLFAVPFLGLFLYYFYGRGFPRKYHSENISEIEKQNEVKIPENIIHSKQIEYDDKIILFSLQQLLNKPFISNKEIEILDNGTSTYEEIFQEIEKAQKHIFITYFIVSDGMVFDAYIELLAKKAAEGVEIYLIYDPVGSIITLSAPKVAELRQAGIHIRDFTIQHKKFAGLFLNYRYHRKLVLIDSKIAMYGGINLGNEYANLSPHYGYWHDNFVKVKGNITYLLEKEFIRDWYLCTKNFINLSAPKLSAPTHNNYTQIVASGPDQNYPAAAIAIEYLISSAKRSLKIMTPYLVIPQNILNLLEAACIRGVKVEIIVPALADKKIIYSITMNTCEKLLRKGALIYTYQNVFMHSKMIIVDEKWSMMGSINLDNRSLFQNFELSTIFYSEKTNLDCSSFFEHAKSSSILIHEITHQSKIKKFKAGFLNILCPLF